MSKITWLLTVIFIFFQFPESVFCQNGGDILNEAPIAPIPADMTFDEYQDMNRRLSVGILLSAVSIPGTIHFYAGEKKTGWKVFGTAVAGVGSIILGAATLDEGDFPDSDFDVLILNPRDKDRQRRYEKIPVEISGSDTTYRLHEIFRQGEGKGSGLVLLGIAAVAGSYLYDFIHGIRVIETKRAKIRYKYGKELKFSLAPSYNPLFGTTGIQLSCSF